MHRTLLLLCPLLLLFACDTDSDTPGMGTTDSFDRQAMLAHWADDIFSPAATAFDAYAAEQDAAARIYEATPSQENFDSLSVRFVRAYLAWQRLSPFLTGSADIDGLREKFNTYPVDTARLLAEPDADLRLPSNIDIQGFPALEYLLFGTADPSSHRQLIGKLTNTLGDNTTQLVLAWEGSFRDNYVNNSGNSATASVDRTVNDFIFWYEKYFRAGKVGIPAGVFSDNPMPALAEAPYHGGLSKQLFLEGLTAAEDFFTTEPGLKDYLDALNVVRDGQLLSERIEDNFATIRSSAESLDEDFATQVRTDNTAMLRLYDDLQANVILLKVDMLQALSINVDYVDADGD